MVQATYRAILLANAAILGIAVGGAPVHAQNAASSPRISDQDSIADIIVTANRREELLQKVPTPITAFNTEQIREQSLSTAADLQGKVPSVQISSNASQRSTEIIVIRGQGQSYLSPVGVVQYFAEVPLIQGGIVAVQGGPGTFFDLESLQVLRGPQGTLFGRNTTGGAVLLGPRKPGNEFSGYVQAQIGNYNDREFEGAIDLPIIKEKLLVRISGKKVDRDGFTKDVGPQPYGFADVCASNPAGCFANRSPGFSGKDYDDKHWWHARVGITFKPTDTIENYLVGYYAKSHDNGTGFILDGISSQPLNLAYLGANLAYQRPLTSVFDPAIANQILAAQQSLGTRKTAMNTDQFTRLKAWGVINTLNVDLSDQLTFRGIASYQRLKQDYNWDLDGSIIPILSQQTPVVPVGSPWAPAGSPAAITNLSQITVEPQLQGSFMDGKLKTAIGAFYSSVKPESVQGTGSFNVGGYNPGTFYDIRTRSIAGYAQASLDFGGFGESLNGLTLTGGLRVTQDRIRGSRYASNFFVIPLVEDTELKITKPTWTIGLDYQATPDVLLFGKVTRGYKSGSFNYAAPRPSGLTSQPEFVTNYEIGAKTSFRVGRMPVRLNVNAYHLDYKGLQRSAGDNFPNGAFVNGVCSTAGSSTCLDQGAIVYNIGGARLRGVEAELTVRPSRGLELSANYSHIDAKYKDYTIPVQPDPLLRTTQTCSGPVAVPFPGQQPVNIDLSCIPFYLAPKHILNLNARYSTDLPNDLGKLVIFAGYSYTSRTYFGADKLPSDDPRGYLEGYGLINGSVEVNGIAGSELDARFFVTNLTNKQYRISTYTGLNSTTGFTMSTYGEPRMYGMSLRYRFGG